MILGGARYFRFGSALLIVTIRCCSGCLRFSTRRILCCVSLPGHGGVFYVTSGAQIRQVVIARTRRFKVERDLRTRWQSMRLAARFSFQRLRRGLASPSEKSIHPKAAEPFAAYRVTSRDSFYEGRLFP